MDAMFLRKASKSRSNDRESLDLATVRETHELAGEPAQVLQNSRFYGSCYMFQICARFCDVFDSEQALTRLDNLCWFLLVWWLWS